MSSPTALPELALRFFECYAGRIRDHLGADLPRRTEKLVWTDDGYRKEEPGDVRWTDFPYYELKNVWLCEDAEEFARACHDELQLPRNLVDPSFLPWEQLKHWVIREALMPLGHAFREAASLTPDEATLEESWGRWEAHWRASGERHRVDAVLQNVELVEDTLIITDGITLQRLTPLLREQLWRNAHAVFDIFPLEAFSRASAVLRVDGTVITPRGGGAASEIEKATRAILALRLVASGGLLPVGLVHTVFEPIIAEPSALLHFHGAAVPLFSTRSRRLTTLSREDTTAAAQVYMTLSALQREERMGGLELSLRRFEQSYLRDWDEDALVDLVIALESTLLADIRDELRYRLALRGAALLRQVNRAAETKTVLSRLYDLRSVIVHQGRRLGDIAGKSPYKWLAIPAFMAQAEDIVRSVLLAFVQRCRTGRSITQIAADLDEEVLRSLS